MEAGVTIGVDDAEFQARLANIILQLGSQSRGLMRAVGYYMRRRTLKHFEEESDPESKPWPLLKERTVAGRRVGPRAKTKSGARKVAILQDTGAGRRSITSLSDATSAEIGTNLYYMIFHQEGAPRAKIPVRAFLGIADEDAGGIEKLAWDYLVRVTG